VPRAAASHGRTGAGCRSCDEPRSALSPRRTGAPLALAIGPTLDPVLEATRDLDVRVAYAATVRPFDADGLRAAVTGSDVVLVEPTLAGTSSPEVVSALSARPT